LDYRGPAAGERAVRRPGGLGLHAVALLTAAATFPLIFMGGLVTSHQAGMSVPDWPNSYGYNMFLFPPRLWIGGIFYEHAHRLMGTVVGLLSIILAAWAWRTESRPWARRLAYGVLGVVIFQGVLGGLRVVLVKLNLAIIHACVAQAFFCLAALVAVVTSRWWLEAPDLSESSAGRTKLVRLGLVAFAVIYAQLVAGAVMRHYEAGLAVTDLPLVYGKILPPMSDEQLGAINRQRLSAPPIHSAESDATLRYNQAAMPVTLGQIWIHVAHRIGALLVTMAVILLIVRVLRRHRRAGLVAPAAWLSVLLAAQLTLGVLTVLLRKPADVASAHVAVGALTLMTTFVLTVRAMRLYSRRFRLAPLPATIELRHSGMTGARLATQ
jgi:cytochrome c oxidase assembly protein subunit 15